MTEVIIRCTPETDLYVLWDTTSDIPRYVGSRRDLHRHLVAQGDTRHQARLALDLAAATGTTAEDDRGSWDDRWLTVGEPAPGDGWYRLPRARLEEYAAAVLAGDLVAAVGMLERYQPDRPAGSTRPHDG